MKDTRRRARLLLMPALVVVGGGLVGLFTSGALAGASPAPKAPDPSAVRSTDNADPITYSLPPASSITPGEELFEANCSSCHGTAAF
ncbi:MAG TPA: cytochrome c, partial [Acidimicrobiales bacterium]|nr:cytochrome c [Acidimicrobiales bacterium]